VQNDYNPKENALCSPKGVEDGFEGQGLVLSSGKMSVELVWIPGSLTRLAAKSLENHSRIEAGAVNECAFLLVVPWTVCLLLPSLLKIHCKYRLQTFRSGFGSLSDCVFDLSVFKEGTVLSENDRISTQTSAS
jgi:hypothetical protein